MKKANILYVVMLLMSLSISFTACSEDDDIQEPVICPTDGNEAAKWISGSYDGVMSTVLTSANFNNLTFPDTANQKITIAHDSINHVTVTYKDWSNGGTNYGNLVVSPVTTTVSENGTILVNGACKQTLYKGGRGFEADVTIKGTIAAEDKQCNLLFTVDMPVSPMMTLHFTLTYNGLPEEE